jgi:hypothetical protein
MCVHLALLSPNFIFKIFRLKQRYATQNTSLDLDGLTRQLKKQFPLEMLKHICLEIIAVPLTAKSSQRTAPKAVTIFKDWFVERCREQKKKKRVNFTETVLCRCC